MPIYQYKCTVCADRFEVEQPITAEPLATLPGCHEGEHRLKKVFSPIGIAFRGSGFYRNEARSGSKTGADKADKAASSPEPSSSPAGNGSKDRTPATASAGD
jgi:putative FmdB family regulatory protein